MIATLVAAVVVTLLLTVVAVTVGQQLFSGGDAQKAVSEIQALGHARGRSWWDRMRGAART